MIGTEQIQRIGYVLKMYPRLSETFIVNEVLANEDAGLTIDIFSLRYPIDGRFHENLARVRAPVTYIADRTPKIDRFWQELRNSLGRQGDNWLAKADLQFESARDVYQAIVLARKVRERGVTHLHAHFASAATTVARMASQIAGIPFSFTAHAKDIFHNDVRLDDLHRKLSQAKRVVTVSDYNVNYLQDTFGPAASNVQRIYNGLDLDDFCYTSPSLRQPKVLAVGRLVEKKGFSDLITACSILAARGSNFHCDIVGDGLIREQLERQVKELNLGTIVKLLGSQPQGTVKILMQRAAVFAAPCVVGRDGNRDGLPTVLLEAMALGAPSISTDVTGIPELLVDGQTGLMVPQNDPLALAEAIESLLSNRALRVRLATKARRQIEQQFDIHINTQQFRSAILDEAAPDIAWSQPVMESV